MRHSAQRVRAILRVVARHGLADRLQWLDVPMVQERLRGPDGQRLQGLPFEARVRLALLELGPAFIKLGQMLGTRPDLIGAELAAELARLQAETIPDPPEVVRRAIEQDLGAAVPTLFAAFDDAPLASASIAQVHCAVLHDGQQAVVKVLRSGVAAQLRTDLEILAAFAAFVERRAPSLRRWQPQQLARQLRRMLERELDFAHERASLEGFAARFRDRTDVKFPAVHAQLSRGRVLTMERLFGVTLQDADALLRSGRDLGRLARAGASVWIDMIFRDGSYHADPHPGNLMLLTDGRLGILDCGMSGSLDRRMQEDFEDLLVAAMEGDHDELCAVVMRIGHPPSDLDRDGLRLEIAEFLDDYVSRPLERLDVGQMLSAFVGILRRRRVTLPAQLALLLRTLVVLEGSSRALDRDFSLAEILVPAQRRALRRRWSPARMGRRAARAVRDAERLFAAAPNDLREILERLRGGSLRVRLDHRHLDQSVDRLTMGILIAALALAATTLWTAGERAAAALGFGAAGALGLSLWRSARRARRDPRD